MESIPFFFLKKNRKFIVQNILFKFVLDVKLKENFFMYGGEKKNDENAIKAASHELKGLLSYYSTDIEGLSFPLVLFHICRLN